MQEELELDIDVRQIKLVNGDEVVGLINRVIDEGWMIESPLLVEHVSSTDTKAAYSLIPWMGMCSTDLVFVPATSVVAMGLCEDDIKERFVSIALKYRQIKEGTYEEEEPEVSLIEPDDVDPDRTVH